MDRGAWRATVHGVARSWTRLKRFSTHARARCCHGGMSRAAGTLSGLFLSLYMAFRLADLDFHIALKSQGQYETVNESQSEL